jgi:ketosteroid isomerase-like protein
MESMQPAITPDPGAQIFDAGRRFLQLFALNEVAKLAACYTEDAQMFAANMSPVRGRAAIESVFKFTGGRGQTLEFRTEELDVHGSTAIEIGAYVRKEQGGVVADEGRYIVIWKRICDEWKIHRDMFSSSRLRGAVRGATP